MVMRVTHTFATMEISASAYDEIKAKLLAAGYDHAIMDASDDNALDMHGIGLIRGAEAEPDWWYRDLDPDDSGYTPHDAMSHVPFYCVSYLHSNFIGPEKFAVKYVKPNDDEEYVDLFDDHDAALAFAKEKHEIMKAAFHDED